MSFIDEAKQWALMPVPGPETPEETQKQFDAMLVEELASTWCALQHVGLRDRTEGTWTATLYFDRLPFDNPERAFAVVRAVLAFETDRSVLMQLNDRLMLSLINAHGADLADRIEAEARTDTRFAWLLGGAYRWTDDKALKERLGKVADADGWRAADEARRLPAQTIDFAALSISELAKVWVAQHALAEKDRDDTWFALDDRERELERDVPDAVIDLALEVLKIEQNPNLLGLFAAGPLENVVGPLTIDRIEREAAADPRFRELVCGVWYFEDDDIKPRLDAIMRGNS
jgi:hypothetical protein